MHAVFKQRSICIARDYDLREALRKETTAFWMLNNVTKDGFKLRFAIALNVIHQRFSGEDEVLKFLFNRAKHGDRVSQSVCSLQHEF